MTDPKVSDVIYENIGSGGQLDLKTHTEKHQPPQLTGSVSVKSRKQRAVEVCLCLLCALLLMAVIALCVYFTIERKHLLTRITNLTEEREQILKHNNNLTEEREQILKHNNNLTEERDQIKNKFDELQHGFYEQDQLAENFKWIYFNFSFYYISSEKKNWYDSRRDCQQRGADLAIMKSQGEREFLQKAAVSGPLWVGLTKTYGFWQWIDGTAVSDWNWSYQYYSYSKNFALMTSSGVIAGSFIDSNYWVCKRAIKEHN